jgi:hypothetical protein
MTTATQCAGLATLLALTTASPSFAQTRTTMPNGYPSHYCLPTTVDSAEEQKVYCEGLAYFPPRLVRTGFVAVGRQARMAKHG